MKLEDILRQLPEEQVQRLVARRQLSLVIADFSDLRTIAHYLTRERNFVLAYSGVPAESSQVLLEIAQQGGRGSIVGNRHRLQPLAAEGLLFLLPPENPQQAVIPDEYLFYLSRMIYGPYLAYSTTEKHGLIDCLQMLEDQAILDLAKRVLPQVKEEHPARMAAELKAFFEVRKNVDAVLRRLSSTARQVFQHLLDCGARTPLAAVRAHFGDQIGPLFGYYSKASGKEKLSPLDELEQYGLVFRLGRRDSCTLVVPHEIFDHFLRQILKHKEARRRELLAQARHEKVQPAKTLPATARIENDLLKLLLQIQAQGLRATRRGTPHRQDLSRILRRLGESDLDRLLFLVALSTEAGFLRLSTTGATITAEAEEWFDQREPKKVRSLFSTWLHMQLWDETRTQTAFAEGPAARAQQSSLVSSLRCLVKDALLEHPAEEWISLKTFLLLCRQDPDFDRMVYLLEAARHFAGGVDSMVWTVGPRNPVDAAALYEADADTVLEKILRSLHYLGLLDLGLDHNLRVQAIRKTRAGEAILQGEVPPGPQPSSSATKVTVQPNLEIIAPTDLPLHLLLELATFCEVQSVDHVIIYRLSAKSLARAVNSGRRLQELHTMLGKYAERSLPQAVDLLFDSLAQREGEIELGYAGGFLRVRDPYLLAELKSRQVLDKVIAQEASETVVLLRPHVDLNSLQESLRKKGYFVRLMDGEERGLPKRH
jgi:hypothetical protein